MTQLQKNKPLIRILSLFISITFLSSYIFPSFVHASDLTLPKPTQLVPLSDSYSFPLLKGMKFDPSNPLNMEFILDTANKQKVTQDEASILIKYFLAGLTIPEEELWVNMSPYEADKMITPSLSQTDLGKDLLSQDYILKQLSSSLTYPETETGKDFWLKTYQEVLKVAKTTDIPINTFNKLWIVPDKALIHQNGNFAFIKEAKLKVMLEEDYLALNSNISEIKKQAKGLEEELIHKVNEASSNVVRNIILPKIANEINQGKNFATLRQIYYSLILGVWFKQRFKDSIYSYYINQAKTKGIDLPDTSSKDKIYNLYVEAFKKGVYNYTKSEKDLGTGKRLRRQYFSGGIIPLLDVKKAVRIETVADSPVKPGDIEGPLNNVGIEIQDAGLMAASPATQKVEKKVFFFGEGKSEGASLISDSAKRKILLGGKGAGLNEMTAMGIPVPPGFTIDTTVGVYYLRNNPYPPGLKKQIYANLKKLESILGRKFGDPNNPLLLSVRSGARKSMPGMMDTVLNLGLNDLTVEGLGRKSNNLRFAYDSYRRFIAAFAKIVLEIKDADEKFSEIFDQVKREENIELSAETDASLSYEVLRNKVITRYKALVLKETGKEFPIDPTAQLDSAIEAVFKSWNSQRAQDYREQNKIPADWGTACNVQAMVFGNTGENSGTGVYFTRDNSTGGNVPFGDFLFNAQGEDVVSGEFNTLKIADLKERMPDIHRQLMEIGKTLETEYRDMQDIEFTIEEGKLYILQQRSGKRTGLAAIKIAVDMVKESLITKKEAVLRVEGADIAQLVHPQIDPKEKAKPIAEGRAGSLGASWGKITFDAEGVLAFKAQGDNVILVRTTTSTSDFKGMVKSDGILTARGGETSHAAIVCKSERKVGVFGAAKLIIDYKNKTVTIGNLVLREGDIVTLDATNKKVYLGKRPLIQGGLTEEAKELLVWDDEIRRLGVRANADTPEQAKKALEFGAKGIGLLRVEHWIQINPELQKLFQLWILTDDPEIKQIFLNKIEPLFRKDMKEVLKTMQGHPVIVRTLDPPLHEFLPQDTEEIKELARELNKVVQQHTGSRQSRIRELLKKMLEKIDYLHEVNPMLGHRGVRLGITDPEITEMQIRAILSAGFGLVKEGIQAIPEVMIPVVAVNEEFEHQEKIYQRIFAEVMKKYNISSNNLPDKFGVIGTMIELPAAAYNAGSLAEKAKFFSFGTNDLTQTTMGLSREDTGALTSDYEAKGIFPYNPFVTLHPAVSYGQMKTAVQRGRKTKPDLEIGICGEHGRDPRSIEIADELGLDYVSPSGDGILVARHVAAQSQIKREMAQASRLTVPLKEAYDELAEIIAAHKQGLQVLGPEFINFKGTFSFEQDKNNPENLLVENFLPILLREIMLEKETPESPDAAIISVTRLPDRRLQFKQITPESIFKMKGPSQEQISAGSSLVEEVTGVAGKLSDFVFSVKKISWNKGYAPSQTGSLANAILHLLANKNVAYSIKESKGQLSIIMGPLDFRVKEEGNLYASLELKNIRPGKVNGIVSAGFNGKVAKIELQVKPSASSPIAKDLRAVEGAIEKAGEFIESEFHKKPAISIYGVSQEAYGRWRNWLGSESLSLNGSMKHKPPVAYVILNMYPHATRKGHLDFISDFLKNNYPNRLFRIEIKNDGNLSITITDHIVMSGSETIEVINSFITLSFSQKQRNAIYFLGVSKGTYPQAWNALSSEYKIYTNGSLEHVPPVAYTILGMHGGDFKYQDAEKRYKAFVKSFIEGHYPDSRFVIEMSGDNLDVTILPSLAASTAGVKGTANSPLQKENQVASPALQSKAPYGGIDLERITVDTTGVAASSPINAQSLGSASFNGGLTFRIIKLEEIRDLNRALSEFMEPVEKKHQLAHKG